MVCWTQPEIVAYAPRDHPLLNKFYCEAGIPPSNPERRAHLIMHADFLTPTDYDVLSRETAIKGRPAAMNLLEDLAIRHLEQEALAK